MQWWKRVRRWTAGTLVVLGVGLVATLDRVSFEPAFRQAEHLETRRRLTASAAVAPRAEGNLSAGFGRARLTPTLGAAVDRPEEGQFVRIPLAGYGARKGKPAQGVHDDVHVKAVVLQAGDRKVAMVAVEALIVPPDVATAAAERVQRSTGIRREEIYFGATHTHASLGGWGEGLVAEAFAGPFQAGVREWWVSRIEAAVTAAAQDLRPAQIGATRFAAPEFVKNRLVGELGRVDPEFSCTVIRQTGGRTAVLGSFAAHATVLSADEMAFSGDYPGYWARAVEEATGGVAVFFAGAVGSHGPVAGGKGHAGAERMGKALAERVLAALPQVALAEGATLSLRTVELALPELQVRVTDGWRLRPWLAQRLLPWGRPALLQALRLNDQVWLSTPCDYSGELGLELKDLLRARGFAGVVTGFNGGYVGYVLPRRYDHYDSYESQRMSFFGPQIGETMEDTLRTLALEAVAR
jgi:hypothetical protein